MRNLSSTQEKASGSLRRDKMPSRHSVVTQYTAIVTRNPANLSARIAALSANMPTDSSRQAAQLSPGGLLCPPCARFLLLFCEEISLIFHKNQTNFSVQIASAGTCSSVFQDYP